MTEHRPQDPEERRIGDDVTPAPLGGDEVTEEQLTADNEVEEDSLNKLNPDDSPA